MRINTSPRPAHQLPAAFYLRLRETHRLTRTFTKRQEYTSCVRSIHAKAHEHFVEVPGSLQDGRTGLEVVLTSNVAIRDAAPELVLYFPPYIALDELLVLVDHTPYFLHVPSLREPDEYMSAIRVRSSLASHMIGITRDIYRNYLLIRNLPLPKAGYQGRQVHTFIGVVRNTFDDQCTVGGEFDQWIGPLTSTLHRFGRRGHTSTLGRQGHTTNYFLDHFVVHLTSGRTGAPARTSNVALLARDGKATLADRSIVRLPT